MRANNPAPLRAPHFVPLNMQSPMLARRFRPAVCVAAAIALGCVLRFVGLTRGQSDFVLPEAAAAGRTEAFYNFHPDEETLLRRP